MKSTTPFFHLKIDNFLSSSDLQRIQDFYNKQKFYLKHTDLFKFLQTDEFAQESDIDFFKCKLYEVFKDFTDITHTFFTMFASYYRKGDYLSCHDDLVEERMYAFTFYLDDLDSGDLILFNNECNKEYKRISIKMIRLIIFQVSAVSFHEVDICKHDRRKAITGWLNKNGYVQLLKNIEYNYSLPVVELIPFDLDDFNDNVLVYEGVEYDFRELSSQIEGPFLMRRVTSLNLNTYLALDIPGHTLCYINCYSINYDSYILLNDYTNQLEGDLVDVFIIESKDNNDSNIKLVNEEGSLVSTLKLQEKVMYVVNRKKMKYFIERGFPIEYKLVHMIYKFN